MSSTFPVIALPQTTVEVSRFIFGTASLFNAGNRSKRLALLEAAVDAGFTHFDTAPYYGFGMAERDLGELSRRGRSFSVTTKVGIHSPGGEDAPYAAVFARKAAGRLFRGLSRPEIDFSLRRARASLEASLRRLARDRVEIYMLHEPELAMLDTDEWRSWLESQVQSGKIRAWGLALTAERLVPFLENAPQMTQLVQVLDSLTGREADVLTRAGNPLQITYGYVSAERQRGETLSVESILMRALQRNADGAVIVSTTRPERMEQYVRILAGINRDS